jgi:hypothetical protein
MGGKQSFLKDDIVDWYLTRNGSGYDIHGKVLKQDQTKEIKSLDDIKTKEKNLGSVGQTMCDIKANNCLQITDLVTGVFILAGNKQNYRLHYDHPKTIFKIGIELLNTDVSSHDLLNVAYNSIIEKFDDIRALDNRSDKEIAKARSGILPIGLGKHAKLTLGADPTISVAGMDFSLSNMLGGSTTKELRTMCNNNGISCRNSKGNYSSKSSLKKKLLNIIQ